MTYCTFLRFSVALNDDKKDPPKTAKRPYLTTKPISNYVLLYPLNITCLASYYALFFAPTLFHIKGRFRANAKTASNSHDQPPPRAIVSCLKPVIDADRCAQIPVPAYSADLSLSVMKPTILLGLALCVSMVCLTLNAPAANQTPAAPLAVPDDWQTIKAGNAFTFKAPPDLQEKKVQGIDSFVREYVSKDMTLSFDYGWYSDPMNREGYKRSETIIDGRKAYIATKDKMMGVYFPNVHLDKKDKREKDEKEDNNGKEDKKNKMITKLTMYIYLSGADPKTAETIFHTIDFPDENK